MSDHSDQDRNNLEELKELQALQEQDHDVINVTGTAGNGIGSTSASAKVDQTSKDTFIADLQKVRAALDANDARALEEFFTLAKQRRDAWCAGSASPSPE